MKKMRLMVKQGTVTYALAGTPVLDTDEIETNDPLVVGPNTIAGVRLELGKPLLLRMRRGGGAKTNVHTRHPLAKRKGLPIQLTKSPTKVLRVIVATRRRSNQYQVLVQL